MHRGSIRGKMVGAAAFVCVAAILIFTVARSQQLSDPTRLQEHAKLYHEYSTGKNLPEMAATGTGDIEVRNFTMGSSWAPQNPSSYPSPYLVDSATRANAVVLGTLNDSVSALTEDHSYIFTDFTMSVEEVIKDNPVAPIKMNRNIMITRPGESLVMNGRTVRAVPAYFLPFHVGRRYLLFLSYILKTGAYRCDQDGSFELFDHGVGKMTPRASGVPMENRQDPIAFLNEVRAASSTASKIH